MTETAYGLSFVTRDGQGETPGARDFNPFQVIDLSDCQAAVGKYRKFEERCEPCDIRVVLQDHGSVHIYASRKSAGTSLAEWNGVDLAFSIHPRSARYFCKFLNSEEVQELFRTIDGGHEVEWNGSNHVGVLDDDARDAANRLRSLCENHDLDSLVHWKNFDADDEGSLEVDGVQQFSTSS